MIPQFNPLSSFYPLSLFANGEPGFWLDPSDFSTMYQTSDGVTPVTAVEQPVGLILDKSQGLVLGSELVTNGDFSNGTTGWTAGVNNTLSVVSGACKSITTSANGAFFGQSFAVVAGKTYKFQFDSISDGTSLAAYACLGTANGISNRYPGASIAFGTQRTFYYLSPNTETIWIWFYGGVGQPANNYILIDNVSCKSLAGAHYYQSTAGVRPVLSGRVNGISKTENLAVSPWIKTGGITSATATTAPDGTSTAFAVLCAANSTAHQMYQLSVIAGTQVTNYVIAKQGTVPWLAVNFDSSATVDGAFFNLATGTKGTVAAGTTATIDPHPLYSGWYICTVTRTYTSANHYFGIEVHTADNQAAAYAAAGTETVLVWHPDLRPTDQATGLIPTYQRVNTSTDYDTAGFPLYLSSNGTQWMQCATQDYTGVNKIMICAGVRKISDAALAVVFELSPRLHRITARYCCLPRTQQRQT